MKYFYIMFAYLRHDWRVLRYLQTNPEITNRECRGLLGLSDEWVRKELEALLKNGLLQKEGARRSTHYVLIGD